MVNKRYLESLENRLVLDWNRRPVGRVGGVEEDPRTHDPARLRILLDPSLVPEGAARVVDIPMDKIFGIRRETVQLNDSVLSLVPRLAPVAPEAPLEPLAPQLD